MLLLAAALRNQPNPADWPAPSALQAAPATARDPQTAAVLKAVCQNHAVLADWPWPDALELACRVVCQWPALADPAVAPGVLRGWLEAEPRLLDWTRAEAWQAAGTDPALRDLLWGVLRAFVREVAADVAPWVARSYEALGLLVQQEASTHARQRLLVGTDARALQQLGGQPPRVWPAPDLLVSQPQPATTPPAAPPLEQLAFACGLKPVLRIDHVPVAAVPALVAQLRSEALWALPGWQRYAQRSDAKALRLSGAGLQLTCVFVARNEADVVAAARADATEKSPVPRPLRDAATQTLGRLLGYPTCCTTAFLTHADQGANDDWCTRVARYSLAGPHPWSVNTWRDLAEVLPFCPCSWDCVAARAYARTLMAELRRREPEQYTQLRNTLRGVVLAWPAQAGLGHGSVLLRDCSVVYAQGEPVRVDFAATLHWSQLVGLDSAPDLPPWLFAARAGGQLTRTAEGWQLALQSASALAEADAPQGWNPLVLVLDFQAEPDAVAEPSHADHAAGACTLAGADAR